MGGGQLHEHPCIGVGAPHAQPVAFAEAKTEEPRSSFLYLMDIDGLRAVTSLSPSPGGSHQHYWEPGTADSGGVWVLTTSANGL